MVYHPFSLFRLLQVASFAAIEDEDTAMSFNDVYGSDEDEDDDDDEENSRGTNNSAAATKEKKKSQPKSKGGALDKAWDDIIPVAMRAKMEEEDRQQVGRRWV